MRNIVKTAALVLGISAATIANAQNGSDPSYSIHNYKHPNKAAKMKAIEDAKPELYLKEIKSGAPQEESGLTASANYKGMSARKTKTRQFEASASPEVRGYFLGNTSANYKQQFPARTRKSNAPESNTEPGHLAID